MPLGCLASLLMVIISAIRVTVAIAAHKLIIKPFTGWFILIDDRLNNQTDFHWSLIFTKVIDYK